MTTIKIDDVWFENIYHKEFNSNPLEFIETVKTLLLEKFKKDEEIYELWSNNDLNNISQIDLSTPLNDNEDYSKW